MTDIYKYIYTLIHSKETVPDSSERVNALMYEVICRYSWFLIVESWRVKLEGSIQ